MLKTARQHAGVIHRNPAPGLRTRTRTRMRWAVLALLAASGLGAAACNSFHAARAYQEGTRALDRGDPMAAIEALERAARLAPNASEVQNHLGLAYRAGGDAERALASLRRAVALDCENRAAQTNLALVEREAGQREEATP